MRLLDRSSRQNESVLIPFMTMMEARYKLVRLYGRDAAMAAIRLVREWPVGLVESNPAWGVRAAEIKARGGLSLGDAWIAALAVMHDAELLHKDPEFDSVEGLRSYPLR